MQKKGGYGLVFQDVTRNKSISAAAKGVYAYLAAFCGALDECYPSVDTITSEMGMGKDTFYRHINALVAAGVVQKKQIVGKDGKFSTTVYKLTHEVAIQEKPCMDFPYTDFPDTVLPDTDIKETIINNITNSNITNSKVDYQLIADMYNSICISFPRLTVLSEKRKRTIKARLNSYTVDDFKRLFEMAEKSSFLKGRNNRDWSATFDWLIQDGNMAKVLDGNYADKEKIQSKEAMVNEASRSIKLW